MFLFLSYGHDQFSTFALRLKQDLESHDHEVWFDEHQIPGAGSTGKSIIEKGLIRTIHEKGKLILMTEHSMRQPDGFCLNEIDCARSRRNPIIPTSYAEAFLEIQFL